MVWVVCLMSLCCLLVVRLLSFFCSLMCSVCVCWLVCVLLLLCLSVCLLCFVIVCCLFFCACGVVAFVCGVFVNVVRLPGGCYVFGLLCCCAGVGVFGVVFVVRLVLACVCLLRVWWFVL